MRAQSGRLGAVGLVALGILGGLAWAYSVTLPAGGTMPPVTTLTQADNGKTVQLRVGDTLALHLHENAATGYRWAFDDLDGKLVDVKEAYVARSEAVGGGGTMQWTLEAKAPGTTQIRLKRWRRWEGDSSTKERFSVTLIIGP